MSGKLNLKACDVYTTYNSITESAAVGVCFISLVPQHGKHCHSQTSPMWKHMVQMNIAVDRIKGHVGLNPKDEVLIRLT